MPGRDGDQLQDTTTEAIPDQRPGQGVGQGVGQASGPASGLGQRRTERWDDVVSRPAVIGATPTGRTDPDIAEEARRERFGGLNPGAAFFGWLVAVAVSALLAGIVGAVALVVGVSTDTGEVDLSADPTGPGIAAAVGLLVVLVLASYAGGYVAGRMSRFSGVRQGLGVWVIGLLVTVAAGVLVAVFGSDYDPPSGVDLPRLSVSASSLGTAAIVAVAVVVVATLLAALAGGAVGTRYHAKVDRFGWES